jgi:general secretion pathway protein K|tara:strand:- start:1330 stop:2298 length:969 start_codon:yes stop_codon:yes gene_type:complete
MNSKTKGVVLISILLVVLLLSAVAVTFGNKYLLSLKRSQYIDFQSLSLNSFRNIESLSYRIIDDEYRFNSKKLSKNNPIINNQIYFNFDNTEIIGNISDASNCFNINSMVLSKDGNYLENTQTTNAFRRLMNSFDIEDNLIEEIIDQIIDWIDKDSNPRAYGLEDYYYSGPLHNPREYSGMRLFISIDELKSIPAIKNVEWQIFKNHFCTLPSNTSLSFNINTLTKKDNLLLSSIYPNIDIADAEYIIDNIPMEGFENKDNLQKAFPEFDFSLSYGNIAFTSKIFKLNTIIKSDDFSASSQSIINYGNNKNSYIISRIYNGI